MSQIILFIILCFSVRFSTTEFCEDDFKLKDFPEGLLKNLLSIAIQGAINEFKECPSNVTIEPQYIRLWLWNANHPDTPIRLNNTLTTNKTTSEIDPNLPTILLIPGWLCNVTNDRMPELKTAYLKKLKNQANIIGVDWSHYSISLYAQAFCFLPLIAREVGKFICGVNATLDVDVSRLHLVGHSMGGQMSGLIGQEVQKQCGRIIGRITAADPAGPLFQDLPESQRLDKTDAGRVEIIHTNQLQFGYYGNCGTVDFYPNCGTFQPGCFKTSVNTNPADLLNLSLGVVNCNHLRAADYMVESINSDGFVATSCTGCPGLPFVGPCLPDVLRPSRVAMGEPCPANPPHEKYVLTTNRESPYARGTAE